MNSQQKEDSATLEILQVIENKNDVTQRHIADKLDVALGLANSYLKRCVHKGLVKIYQAPANRYFYYLTPKGFAEKSRLTAQYLSSSFEFYRRAGDSFKDIYKICESKGWKKIILVGISELTEIALLRAHKYQIEIDSIFQVKPPQSKYLLGIPIISSLSLSKEYDAVVLTELLDIEFMLENLNKQISNKEIILIPEILGIKEIHNI